MHLPLYLLLLAATPVSENIEVRVMEIEAVVVDTRGNVIEGLQQGDFEVFLDGKRREPSNFYAVRRNRIVDSAADASVQPMTALPTSLVIFIDETRLRQGSKARALAALDRYIRENVGALTSAMIITYNGGQLNVRTRPTERPGPLLTELAEIANENFLGHGRDSEREDLLRKIDDILTISEERRLDLSPDHVWYELVRYVERETGEVDRALKALREAIHIAAGFHGRKVLLYISEGLPQMPGSDLLDYWQHLAQKSARFSTFSHNQLYGGQQIGRFDRTNAFQALANESTRANVAFFSYAAGGAGGLAGADAQNRARAERFDNFLLTANREGGARILAEQTGGRYVGNENDVDRVLSAMSAQFSTYYSIGVSTRKFTRADIRVRVKNRPDLRVITARRREPLTVEEETAQRVRSRLYAQHAENPLSANIAIGAPVPMNGRCVATVRVEVPPTPAATANRSLMIQFAVLNERNDESDVRAELVPASGGAVTHAFSLGCCRRSTCSRWPSPTAARARRAICSGRSTDAFADDRRTLEISIGRRLRTSAADAIR